MSSKLSKFIQANGAINQIFKSSLLLYHSRLNIYKTSERFVLAYVSKPRTIRNADEKRLSANGVKFMRRSTSYILLDHKHNEDILESLKMQ
jgi:hypothetical protein